MEELVDSARHLSLHPLCDFHSTLDGHLTKIYSAFPADATEKAHYFETTQNESTPQDKSTTDPLASLDSFRSYMKDTSSSAQALAYQVDSDEPISDYFVSSSHNTYLTGNQLYSDAAASAYTSVSVQLNVFYFFCGADEGNNLRYCYKDVGPSKSMSGMVFQKTHLQRAVIMARVSVLQMRKSPISLQNRHSKINSNPSLSLRRRQARVFRALYPKR